MTSFPEDIRKKAETLVSGIDADWSWDGQEFDYSAAQQDTVNAIAQALLDERERCARIAENLIEKRRGLSLSFDMIAAAIRSPDTAQGTPA